MTARSALPDRTAPAVVDWHRMAEPQADGYDTVMTLALALQRLGYERPAPEPPAILGGRVRVRSLPATVHRPEPLVEVGVDHPGVARAEDWLLRAWPEAAAQFVALVDTVTLLTDPRFEHAGARGSSSGGVRFGWVFGTVFDPVGAVEAWLHEMAHAKLAALGVEIEQAHALLLNGPDELYVSPVRRDRLRPMSAVLHATYSWTYLTAFDLRVAALDAALARPYLEANVPRLERGLAEIRAHARTDAEGRAFLDGFGDWCKRVIAAGHAAMQ
jgi:HEXXH motif-containing protein